MKKEIQTETQTEPKITHCLNCDTEFEGNFCPECGQSAETGRFTMRFILENLLAAFLSKDGGIWFTLKNLFTRPGAMIVEILNGKRRRYFSPFPMLFCVLTVYILLYTLTGSRDSFKAIEHEFLDEGTTAANIEVDINLGKETKETVPLANDLKRLVGMGFRFYNSHYTAVTLLTIPFFLFATRSWYGKSNRKRYYRAEYLVAIAYSLVMVVLYRCLSSLVYLFSKGTAETINSFIPLATIVAFTVCFQKMLGFNLVKTAWRSLLALVLYYLILGVILLIAAILFYLFVKSKYA